MKSSGLSFAIRLFSVFCLASFAACAYASNGYAISATNVTMPASGTATTKYTVSEIPIRGDLSISCAYSGPQTDANLPVCDGGPSVLIPVNAGQTVTGSSRFLSLRLCCSRRQARPAKFTGSGPGAGRCTPDRARLSA